MIPGTTQIEYGNASCSTCHDEDYIQAHATSKCGSCHQVGFDPSPSSLTNWQDTLAGPHVFADALASQIACGVDNPACHALGSDAEWHGLRPAWLTARHAISQTSWSGCSDPGGSGMPCHQRRTVARPKGFSFGAMDLASAHNDFWLAIREGRTSDNAVIVPSMQGDDNPSGCGLCHAKPVDGGVAPMMLKPAVAASVAGQASRTCNTCHSDASAGAYTALEDVCMSHAVPATLKLSSLNLDLSPVQHSTALEELFAALSPQTKLSLLLKGDRKGLEAGTTVIGKLVGPSNSR